MRLAIVAVKFTPEEANDLRRSMATFRNSGIIHKFREKMVAIRGRCACCSNRAISTNIRPKFSQRRRTCGRFVALE